MFLVLGDLLFEAPLFFLRFMAVSFALPYPEPSVIFLVGTGILNQFSGTLQPTIRSIRRSKRRRWAD